MKKGWIVPKPGFGEQDLVGKISGGQFPRRYHFLFQPGRPRSNLGWASGRVGKKTAKKAGPVIRGRAGPCDYNWVRLSAQRGGEDGGEYEAGWAFCKTVVGPPAPAHGGPAGLGQIL